MVRTGDTTDVSFDYIYNMRLEETYRQPVFSACFNDFDPALADLFATAGSNQITIYRLPSFKQKKVTIEGKFIDTDKTESFYTSIWTLDRTEGHPLIVAAGLSGTIKIIDVKTQMRYRNLLGHVGAVNELRRHPCNPYIILSASKDRSVRLWNVYSGVCVAMLFGEGGHLNEALSADFSADGRRIVSCGMDHTVKIWTVDKLLQTAISNSFHDEYVTPDDHEQGGAMSIFPICFVPFPVFSTDKVHNDYIDCVRYYGELILSKSTESNLILWEPIFERQTVDQACPITIIQEFPYFDDRVWFLRFQIDPTRRHIVVGNTVGKMYSWDLERPDARQLLQSSKSTATIRGISFSQDGRFLIAAGDSGFTHLWKRRS